MGSMGETGERVIIITAKKNTLAGRLNCLANTFYNAVGIINILFRNLQWLDTELHCVGKNWKDFCERIHLP